ncbi:MAG: hypothetical protein AAGF12_41655 [Myxococcota bacterium]
MNSALRYLPASVQATRDGSPMDGYAMDGWVSLVSDPVRTGKDQAHALAAEWHCG